MMKRLSGQIFLILTLLVLGALALMPVDQAQAQDPTRHPVDIYFFWGDGCPHCAKAKPFLEGLAAANPQVILHSYEIYYSPENQALFGQMAAAFGFEPHGVPTIFIGERYWEGYAEQLEPEISGVVTACLTDGCPNKGGEVLGLALPAQPTAAPTQVSEAPAAPSQGSALASETPARALNIPLLGTIDLSKQSLFISTALIAFVDGFNPCSLWALSMLLAITIHTGSRKKVLLIGAIFLTVTAGVYALFIAGLFSVLKIISFMGWVQVVVALAALFFGLVNIKDYFWYKEGISLTIADEQKPGLLQRMRKLTDASQSTWGLVGGTIVLAAGVSLVEFSCTAGFPVLWTNLLTAQQVGVGAFVLLLLLYMVIYQIDELAIFLAAVYSLKASRLQEDQGRLLKLVGGMLMLTLSLVMVINPSLMNNLENSLIIFGCAFALTGLVLLLHRVILPRFGLQIGTPSGGASSGAHKKRR